MIILFPETGGIPTKQWYVPSCFVFREIIFLLEIGNRTCGIHTRQADIEAIKGSMKDREKSLFLCLYRAPPPPISRQEALRSSLGPGGRVLLLEWELRQDMQKVDDQGETFPKAVPLCMAG